MQFIQIVNLPNGLGDMQVKAIRCDGPDCKTGSLMDRMYPEGWVTVTNAGKSYGGTIMQPAISPPDVNLSDVAFCSMTCLVTYYQNALSVTAALSAKA